MKTNKIALSLATAGLLVAISTNAVAEESGWFLGVKGDIKNLTDYTKTNRDGNGRSNGTYRTTTTTNYQIGILGGYKKFFSPKFGVRFYGVLDYGRIDRDYDTSYYNNTENSFGLGANVEALFNFVETESWGLGAFAGGGLGYVGSWYDYPNGWVSYKRTKHGFDIGVNVGVRVNFGKRHGLEVLNRLGFNTSRHKYDYETLPTTYQTTPTIYETTYIPYSDYSTNSLYQRIELRYVFSF